MNFETTLRKHADHGWPEPWRRHDHFLATEEDDEESSPEWNIIDFPAYKRRRIEATIPASTRRPDVQIELRRLADEWRAATLFTSSIQDMILHPAYQQIIGFGERALPFLIEEIRSSDDYWFWALSMITRTNPVPEDQSGNYRAMKHAWLEWAAANNL